MNHLDLSNARRQLLLSPKAIINDRRRQFWTTRVVTNSRCRKVESRHRQIIKRLHVLERRHARFNFGVLEVQHLRECVLGCGAALASNADDRRMKLLHAFASGSKSLGYSLLGIGPPMPENEILTAFGVISCTVSVIGFMLDIFIAYIDGDVASIVCPVGAMSDIFKTKILM